MNNSERSRIIIDTSSHGTRRYDRDGELLRNLPEHIRQEFNNQECCFHKWEQPTVIGESGGKLTEVRITAIKNRMFANSDDALFILIIGGNDLGEGKKSLKYELVVSVTYECRFKEPKRQKLSD